MLTFLHIPEGVTVTVPAAFMIPDEDDDGREYGRDADPAIGLTLNEDVDARIEADADMDGVVDLNSSVRCGASRIYVRRGGHKHQRPYEPDDRL